MKPWANVILAVILTGAIAAAVHFLVGAGKTACEASHSSAVAAAATHALVQGAVIAKADASNAGHLAAKQHQVSQTTITLEGAIHEPEPRTPAPGAPTRIANPFPAGFSLCWNAAASGDAAAVAACQAARRHADPVPAAASAAGHGQPGVQVGGWDLPGGGR